MNIQVECIEEAQQSHADTTAWDETYRSALAQVDSLENKKDRSFCSIQAGDAERDKINADIEQRKAERAYEDLENCIAKLEKDYRRSINKSK